MSATEPKIFVSYRREGTAMHAGRLYDGVAARFGEQAVFMDLEMALGIDFVDRIETVVSACRVLLVVIGPQWAGDGRGPSRLDDPADFVRLEVETALRSPGVTVIPVLVSGARMPAADRLPQPLRPLARRNAVELTDLKWRYDCTRLMAALDDLLVEPEPEPVEPTPVAGDPPSVPAEPARPRRPRSAALAGASLRALLPLWLEGTAIAISAGMLTRALVDPASDPSATGVTTVLPLVERRAAAWAVIGLALAIWMCVRRGEHDRLLLRALMGLSLGALAGAAGGALYGALVFLPETTLTAEQVDLIGVASIALTGGIVGATVGALWIPRRIGVGFLSGSLGGALATVATNALGHPDAVFALGIDCFAIVGLALLAMMALDVRAAAAPQRLEPAPQAVGA